MDLTGVSDTDDFIWSMVHKLNNDEINKCIVKYNPNNLWSKPSENLIKLIKCDKGSFQHFHNDLWYRSNLFIKGMYIECLYGCRTCEKHGLPCKTCNFLLQNNETLHIFQANFLN